MHEKKTTRKVEIQAVTPNTSKKQEFPQFNVARKKNWEIKGFSKKKATHEQK